MTARRRAALTTAKLDGPLDNDIGRAVGELAGALDALVSVDFAMAWSPTAESPVFIQSIAVNGNPRTPPAGELDPASPYAVGLGSFPDGCLLTISWAIRAYADLNGVRAFARSGTRAWERLDDKVPLQYQGQWKGETLFRVRS